MNVLFVVKLKGKKENPIGRILKVEVEIINVNI